MTKEETTATAAKTKEEKKILLQRVDIDKAFPGVRALDKARLTVRAGTVHALMGENGAGKSTLMKCLFGVYSKDGGTITLDGREIHFKNSKEALENGVAMVHQELNQALKRNVMDNMWLGRFPTVAKGIPLTSEKKMYEATKAIFEKLGGNAFSKAYLISDNTGSTKNSGGSDDTVKYMKNERYTPAYNTKDQIIDLPAHTETTYSSRARGKVSLGDLGCI